MPPASLFEDDSSLQSERQTAGYARPLLAACRCSAGAAHRPPAHTIISLVHPQVVPRKTRYLSVCQLQPSLIVNDYDLMFAGIPTVTTPHPCHARHLRASAASMTVNAKLRV
jgi:hypothetical protein